MPKQLQIARKITAWAVVDEKGKVRQLVSHKNEVWFEFGLEYVIGKKKYPMYHLVKLQSLPTKPHQLTKKR